MLKLLRHPSVLLAIGSTLLAMVLLAAFGVAEYERRDERWVRHTLEVENRLAGLSADLQDAEAGQRSFIITGDRAYLAPMDGALAALPRDLDVLTADTKDNPRQSAALSRLRPLVEERIARLRHGVELRDAQGLPAAAAFIADGRGVVMRGQIRRELASMQGEEERLLADRTARAQAARLTTRWVLGFGLVAIIAFSVLAVLDSGYRFRLLLAGRDALEKANAQLRNALEGREVAEGQMRQMQKLQAVGQLTGGIAHDFNNMLSVIIGSLELARRRLRADPDRAEANIANALEGAERAAGLTSRLLAFSRQQALAPNPLDPNKLVGGMSEMLRRTVGEQINVETVLAGGVWRANADAAQLESAILNLCVNARDAMPDGGRLTLETSNAYLDDDYAASHEEVAPGQYVLISVSDTGVGMPAEVIQRAFEPFYTTKGVGRGTGLGLSQVFGFVKQSGGHVKIYSEVGDGTTIKIYLPRWVGETRDVERPARALATLAARDHEILLVVEDDEKVRHVTVDTLRELGYTVVQAASGDDALQQLAMQPQIDVMITDIIMPGMTGRALADRAQAERPEMKVLFMTGYSRNAVVHNGVLDAGVAFLQKPFTAEQLALKVRQVLDGEGANRPG
jgi:signal transduction histidine kinase/CheY-like chemotaxis protein